MKKIVTILLSFSLSGCIVASEKPRFDTGLIVPALPNKSGTKDKSSSASAGTQDTIGKSVADQLGLPNTCWGNSTDQADQTSSGTSQLSTAVDATPSAAGAQSAAGANAGAPSHAADSTATGPTSAGGGTKPQVAQPISPSPSQIKRNKCIYLIKSIIDDSYLRYRLRIAKQIGLTNEGLDIGSSITSATSTATVGVVSKVFSGLGSVFTGTRAAFNNDALFQQSMQAIFKQMDADRLGVWANIQVSMQLGVDTYLPEQADNDLVEYFRAGTVEAAVSSLDANAGTAANTCKAASNAVGAVTKANNQAAISGSTPTAALVQPPTPASNSQNAAATTTSEQCNQLLQAANKALTLSMVKTSDVSLKENIIWKNIKAISSTNKAELDAVANALGVSASTSYSTERSQILATLETIYDPTKLSEAIDRINKATKQDFSIDATTE